MIAILSNAWKTFKKEILDKNNLIYILITELIFWSPVIFAFVMTLFNNWWWLVISGYIAFWALPIISPAIPLQIGLFLLVKKILKRDGNG